MEKVLYIIWFVVWGTIIASICGKEVPAWLFEVGLFAYLIILTLFGIFMI